MSNTERYIYHFTERETFEQAMTHGEYTPRRFAKDGFIHGSTREQVLHVANFIAPKDGDLVLLEIDTDKVTPRIVYENLEGGEKLFPHIYGPLDLQAVSKVWKFAPVNGEFVFPTDEQLVKATS
jgi:uncharacterized protein (DUF952 family)